MSANGTVGWQDLQAKILERLHTRYWGPGELIPGEAELAKEFGCARATVNRALRSVAEAGLLDRRRKAGTRVAVHPVRKATLDIPIIRKEIEERSFDYGYSLLFRGIKKAPASCRSRLELEVGATALRVEALHTANGAPYVLEERWINPKAIDDLDKEDFMQLSANEWLVMKASFSGGDISFSAELVTKTQASRLRIPEGSAVFVVDRKTWNKDHAITWAKLTYAPGYRMHTLI